MSRGRLPQSVYWRRRLVLLTVVGVVAIVGLKVISHLGGSGSAPDAANLTGNTGQTQTVDGAGSPSDDPAADPSISTGPSGSPLPEPTGDCDPADIVVTPTVGSVGTDGSIGLSLGLHTMNTLACNWTVSAHTMQVKITSRGQQVWSTADCPREMPDQSVVVYRDTTTPVAMLWSGRFSSPGCPTHERWASYGTYKATAAIFGGQPGDDKFSLVAPSKATSSTSPSSTSSTSSSPSTSPPGRASAKTSGTPSGSPSSNAPSGKPSKKH